MDGVTVHASLEEAEGYDIVVLVTAQGLPRGRLERASRMRTRSSTMAGVSGS